MYIFLALFFAFLSASEVPGQPYFNGDGALVLPSNDFENFTADPELKKARAGYLYDRFLNDHQWHLDFMEKIVPAYADYIFKISSMRSEEERLFLKEQVIAMYPTALFGNCVSSKCPYSYDKLQRMYTSGCSDALARFIRKATDRPLHLVLYASGYLATEGRILLQTFQNPSLMQLSKNLIVHCIDPIYKSIENGGSISTSFVMPSFKKLLKDGKPAGSKLKIKGVSFNTSVAEFLKLLATSAEDRSKDKEYYINPLLLVFGIDFDKEAYLKTGSVAHLQQLLGRYQDASLVLALKTGPEEISVIRDMEIALTVLKERQAFLRAE
jgi:hypothetical protein